MSARGRETRSRSRWPACMRVPPSAGVRAALAALPELPRNADIETVLDVLEGCYDPGGDEAVAEIEFERLIRGAASGVTARTAQRADTPNVCHTRSVSQPRDGPGVFTDHGRGARAASVPAPPRDASNDAPVIVTPAARRFRLRVYLLLHLGRVPDARAAVADRVRALVGEDSESDSDDEDGSRDELREESARVCEAIPAAERCGEKRKSTSASPDSRTRTPAPKKAKVNGKAEDDSTPKRKSQSKASPPCLACRHGKVRCDRSQPCSLCKRRGDECVYPPNGSAKQGGATNLTAASVTQGGASSRRHKVQKQKWRAARSAAEAVAAGQSIVQSDSELSEPTDNEESVAAPSEYNGGADVASDSDDEFGVGRRKATPRPKKAHKPATAQSLEPPKKKRRHFGSMAVRNIDGALLRKLGLDPGLADALRGPTKREILEAHAAGHGPPTASLAPRVSVARPAPRPREAIAPSRTTERLLRRERVPGGIPSSAFAVFVRWAAGYPPRAAPRTIKGATPTTRPPVWAQELCEALPYYRAFQSGMYMYRRIAYGYLLDGYPSPRDVWAADGRVIISHGGGQAVRVLDASGRPTVSLAADHTPADARIETLIRAAARHAPVVLLAGEGYALLPWSLGCAYAVLGWYWVSLTWYEAEPVVSDVEPPADRDYFHRLKVRFDWVQSQGTPWWLQTTPGAQPWTPPVTTNESSKPASVAVPSPQAHSSSGSEAPRDAEPTTPARRTQAPGPLPEANSTLLTLPNSALPPTPDSPGHPRPKIPISSLLIEEVRAGLPTQLAHPNASAIPSPPPTPPQPLEAVFLGKRPMARRRPKTPFKDKYFSPNGRPSRLPGDCLLASFTPVVSAEEWHPEGEVCGACGQTSPCLYAEGWICLVPTCTRFWMLRTELGILPITSGMLLHCTPAFLQPAPTPAHVSVPYDVVPSLPEREGGGGTVSDDAGTRTLWRGWVCDECGRANCRYRWEVCECRACGRHVAAQTDADIVPASALRAPETRDVLGGEDEPSPDLVMAVRRLATPPATVVAYDLPEAGTVYHILHDGSAAADALWEAYQRAAINTTEPLFQRRELKANTVKGQLLSQQFAINSGASYKYIVQTLSYPFESSPGCVLEALELIKARVAIVLDEQVNFNEILSVMYREGQKMSWHDDGERGLGPVVAALSLGATATMSFRPKLPRLHREIIPATRSIVPRQQAQAAPVLNLCLAHGDVVIMAGRAIQHLYDHRVVPQGLRVAATARVIGAA